ncbi:hypothetical protein JR316_0002863 [Psilocybe cubensis]|uniref:Uncharacterized protein n=2 Tax=Psilocybe cubensis TaxID=181762 RepID=A0A8H7Y3G7_PSICU|nr:hypothetical protein JR316_0002863 [Psilocybe cubensis]KAH9483397.1 hypothetical protein JR316_0002863 [Psilocybe cubensis]
MFLKVSKGLLDMAQSRKIVLATITVLYSVNVVILCLQWYFISWSYATHGDTKDSIFWAYLEPPIWFIEALNTSQNVVLVIEDGLLIWRCYHVWGQSLKIVAMLLLLLFTESALVITATVLNSFTPILVTNQAGKDMINHVDEAFSFTCLATTFFTTFLIGYRIYTVSRNTNRSISRYKHIFTTILQSAAVHVLLLLVQAISPFSPIFYDIQSRWSQVDEYINMIVYLASGLAPTVMVLHLAVVNETDTATFASSTLMHLPAMEFDNCLDRSTHAADIERRVLMSRPEDPVNAHRAIEQEK